MIIHITFITPSNFVINDHSSCHSLLMATPCRKCLVTLPTDDRDTFLGMSWTQLRNLTQSTLAMIGHYFL